VRVAREGDIPDQPSIPGGVPKSGGLDYLERGLQGCQDFGVVKHVPESDIARFKRLDIFCLHGVTPPLRWVDRSSAQTLEA
jgi:hypothetical protein